jgi:uncharacterized protein YndB with AHSA1/START domain
MTRVFDAPRQLVFEAHTRPEHVRHWWGMRGSTLALCEMDLRPGGAWRFVERQADGNEYGFRGEYREIVPPERLVHTFEFEGLPGHIAVVTTTFEEKRGRTLLTSTTRFDTREDRDGMLQSGAEQGAAQTWERLAEHLAWMPHAPSESDPGIVISRVFEAPRELVFAAWTEPEHLGRWFAPQGFTTPHCTVDLRVGGRFHFCMRSPDGREFWARGLYREIVPPDRLVYVDSFADEKGNLAHPSRYGMSADHPAESVVTVTFADVTVPGLEGRTEVTLRHAIAKQVKEREGAEQGWSEMFDRLAQLLPGA